MTTMGARPRTRQKVKNGLETTDLVKSLVRDLQRGCWTVPPSDETGVSPRSVDGDQTGIDWYGTREYVRRKDLENGP